MTRLERWVKDIIKDVLARYPESYVFMSVPFGYGPSTLDYLICHYGLFISVEAKAPGKEPTARQNMIIRQIEQAGGKHFTIDGFAGASSFANYLERIKENATSPNQSEAPTSRGSLLIEDYQSLPDGQIDGVQWEFLYPSSTQAVGNVSPKRVRVRRPKPDPESL